MSRSTYVYIVRDLSGRPTGAFTVKHELATWLERNGHRHPQDFAGLIEVTRHRDGDPSVPPVTLNPRTLEPAS